MEEIKQILKNSTTQFSQQTSLVKNSTKELATKPKWATEIANRYGNYQNFCNTFSYGLMNKVANAPLRACGGTAPSLVRLDTTYGNGAAQTWLYDILQATFAVLGVNEDKFSKEQILDLACTISSQYRNLKVTEMMLFLARFKAGKYGRFYGGDSYALVITEALEKFYYGERVNILKQVEEKEWEEKQKEMMKNAITFEEYRRRQGGKTNLDDFFG